MPAEKHSAILYCPHWTFSHLCEVPVAPDGKLPAVVLHEGQVFQREETADQHDRQGRVAAYRYVDAPEI